MSRLFQNTSSQAGLPPLVTTDITSPDRLPPLETLGKDAARISGQSLQAKTQSIGPNTSDEGADDSWFKKFSTSATNGAQKTLGFVAPAFENTIGIGTELLLMADPTIRDKALNSDTEEFKRVFKHLGKYVDKGAGQVAKELGVGNSIRLASELAPMTSTFKAGLVKNAGQRILKGTGLGATVGLGSAIAEDKGLMDTLAEIIITIKN